MTRNRSRSTRRRKPYVAPDPSAGKVLVDTNILLALSFRNAPTFLIHNLLGRIETTNGVLLELIYLDAEFGTLGIRTLITDGRIPLRVLPEAEARLARDIRDEIGGAYPRNYGEATLLARLITSRATRPNDVMLTADKAALRKAADLDIPALTLLDAFLAVARETGNHDEVWNEACALNPDGVWPTYGVVSREAFLDACTKPGWTFRKSHIVNTRTGPLTRDSMYEWEIRAAERQGIPIAESQAPATVPVEPSSGPTRRHSSRRRPDRSRPKSSDHLRFYPDVDMLKRLLECMPRSQALFTHVGRRLLVAQPAWDSI